MKIYTPDFTPWAKMYRISREMVITEKLDGANAQISIFQIPESEGKYVNLTYGAEILATSFKDGVGLAMMAGSRTKYIHPGDDNYGFARWAKENSEELFRLGTGNHYGEWWGSGIQRKYNLKEKRFSLFNTSRWTDETLPSCCHVVPILYEGIFDTGTIDRTLGDLELYGSKAAPGFMKPEGIVVFHKASGYLFKKTLGNDGNKGNSSNDKSK